jgi:hypothetical protein
LAFETLALPSGMRVESCVSKVQSILPAWDDAVIDIAPVIHPDQRGHKYMAIFTFKFDESYNDRTLVIGGWIAEETQWRILKRRWRRAIADVNRQLPKGQKISRYHASHMNANDGEFRGWEQRLEMKLWFTKKLFRIVSTDRMIAVASGIDLKAFCDVFPERNPPDYGVAYTICMQLAMWRIGEALDKHVLSDRVTIVHDHGNWDIHALQAFNILVDDPEWEYRNRFVAITPLRWQDDTGLQSADLIAYECMRAIDNELWTGKKMRTAMEELLKCNSGIFPAYLDREALEAAKKELDKGHLRYAAAVSGLMRERRVTG